MAQTAPQGQGLHGGKCSTGCGCQSWHPPDVDDSLTPAESYAQKFLCDGCDHHLSYHYCEIDVCGKKLVKKDTGGNSVIGGDGEEVVLGTCKCTRFIPDPTSKGQKSCHGCSHHTSFHLAQMAPVGVRRISGRSQSSLGLFEESQSQVLPPSISLPVHEAPSHGTPPNSTTPMSAAPAGKKQKTNVEQAVPNMDWVSSFRGMLALARSTDEISIFGSLLHDVVAVGSAFLEMTLCSCC
jgi:hypothetical protein